MTSYPRKAAFELKPRTQRTGSPESSSETRSPGLILTACCLGQFVVVLDVSVINIALPIIKKTLGMSGTSLQWVVNAYTIVFAAFLLLGGRLVDIIGKRHTYLIGTLIFTTASLTAGLAFNPTMLILSRALQGLGAAIIAPASLSILGATFTDTASRARAFGTWGAVAAGAGASGVLIGGVVTQLVSWRWLFLINVPLGAGLAGLTVLAVSSSFRSSSPHQRIDIVSTLTAACGLVAFLYGISRLSSGFDWTVPVLAATAATLLLVFVRRQRYMTYPLLPLRLFARRSVTTANVVAFTSCAAMFSLFYFFPLLLQQVLRYTPIQAALACLPLSLGILVGARLLTPVCVTKLGHRATLLIALIASAVGYCWLSVASHETGVLQALVAPTILIGITQGIVGASSAIVATTDVPAGEIGIASGVLNASQQLGGAVGLASLVVIVSQYADMHTVHSAGAALADGYAAAIVVASLFPLLGAVASYFAPGRRSTKTEVPSEMSQ